MSARMENGALGQVAILRGDARSLPLPDASVDLVCTSPPYWALRDYRDGDASLAGQIGAEPTPGEYIDALVDCTREWMRVLKPTGSLFVNLGDSYSGRGAGAQGATGQRADRASANAAPLHPAAADVPAKSLRGLPWRYALRCIDDLGLILRAEVIWAKPNGLPESVTDRVRRAHEQWFHLVKQPRYYAAVDEIRQPYDRYRPGGIANGTKISDIAQPHRSRTDQPNAGIGGARPAQNPLGALPGSVWEIEGESPVRSVLQAISAGALTVDEGERILTWSMQNGFGRTFSAGKSAGNGRASSTRPDTAGTTPSACRQAGPIASPTNSPSAQSPRGSHSITCAETDDAFVPSTSSPSRMPSTSNGACGQTVVPTDTNTQGTTCTCGRTDGASAEPACAAEPVNTGSASAPPSVWNVATQPLTVPPELGVDHYAAFPLEWPRRIIAGWSSPGICTACGEGRRPVADRQRVATQATNRDRPDDWSMAATWAAGRNGRTDAIITGYACACPEPTAPTHPALIVDPFGGTGTTTLAARALGRNAISVDMSADYCRLAAWRTTDPGELARAMGVPKPPPVPDNQPDLFGGAA